MISRSAVHRVLVALLVWSSAVAHAGQPTPSDSEVKAVYLYNFGRFITWPPVEPADDAFQVCVLGRDPFGPTLDATLVAERVDGRPLRARRIRRPQEAGGCRILFVSESEDRAVEQLLDAVSRSSILTVSDMPRFVARGGMIQFVMQGTKIRFEVNLTVAERAGLTLSSDLLRVASAVRSGPPGR
jgi:hypothetical protein